MGMGFATQARVKRLWRESALPITAVGILVMFVGGMWVAMPTGPTVRTGHAGDYSAPATEPAGAEPGQGLPPTNVLWLPLAILGGAIVCAAGGVAVGFLLGRRAGKAPARPASSTTTTSSSSSAAPAKETRPAPAEPPPGIEIIAERYQLGRAIGEGGMGVVYEAFDSRIKRRVAVKRMRSELRQFAEDRDRFLHEARIVGQLSHPYIVQIHEVLEQKEDIYLVLDFVQGQPLSQLLKEKGRMPLADAIRLFGYVCEAIECAHENKVLHRDLKPSNIMVEERGYAKVMDFGIARQAKETITRLTQVDDSGTPAYMAPEQHMGKANRASDVYALGVCLFETLTGQLPFRGPDFYTQKQLMKFPPPQFLVPELPSQVELLMKSALAADPKDRVQNAGELREVLATLKI